MECSRKVAVVVLDWNGGEETLACLDSVFSQRDASPEVFLVDNASREPVTAEARARFPTLVVLRNERNLGYAGGNNVGLRAARAAGADHVLVLNNDATLEPGALKALLDAARSGDGIAAVGARIRSRADPTRLWMAWGEITYRQSLVRLVGQDAVDGPAYGDRRDVPWVSGCALLLTREGVDAVGLFDEDYFAYHEEVDWCARARARGLRIVYAPAAVVVHGGESSSGGGRYVSRKQYLAARNMVRFVRTHGSLAQRLKFTLFFVSSLPFQLVRRTMSGEQRGVLLKIRGALDALRGRPLPRAELELD